MISRDLALLKIVIRLDIIKQELNINHCIWCGIQKQHNLHGNKQHHTKY